MPSHQEYRGQGPKGYRRAPEPVCLFCHFATTLPHSRNSVLAMIMRCSPMQAMDTGRECIDYPSHIPDTPPQETNAKIAHALQDTGPHTCAFIQNLGFRRLARQEGAGSKRPLL